ncbi:MAG TPA: hypothetical protein VHY20_10985 [Pirellulales bacterium]|nr:hypothetical protein [Pirellulales bacterium]
MNPTEERKQSERKQSERQDGERTPDKPRRLAGVHRPTRFNKWFLLATSAAIVAWVAFLLLLAWKY